MQEFDVDTEHVTIAEDRSLAILRWAPKSVAIPGKYQDEAIEEMVNRFLRSNLKLRVTGVMMKYQYDFLEGDKENMKPRFIVMIYTEPLKNGQADYKEDDRCFRIQRQLFDPDLDGMLEDRQMEDQLNKCLTDEHPNMRVRKVAYQNDLAPVLDGGLLGVRAIVGLYMEHERLHPKTEQGRFYLMRRFCGGKSPAGEDESAEGLTGEWQDSHAREQVITHAMQYRWLSKIKEKALEPRHIILLYAEPIANDEPDRISEHSLKPGAIEYANVGVDVIRYLAPTGVVGYPEDAGMDEVLNEWFEANPDKVFIDLTFGYEFTYIYGGGRQGARAVFGINWRKVEPGEAYVSPRAHVIRRLGRRPDATWRLDEEEVGLTRMIEGFKVGHPTEPISSVQIDQSFGPFLPGGDHCIRQIAVVIAERDLFAAEFRAAYLPRLY